MAGKGRREAMAWRVKVGGMDGGGRRHRGWSLLAVGWVERERERESG